MTKHITLVVTGSIAAVKTNSLVSKLKASGFTLDIILTESAQQWITPEAAEAINGKPPISANEVLEPLETLNKSDFILVAPATANFIYELNHGASKLANIINGRKKEVIIAPAMNPLMWEHPATQRNVKSLLEKGTKFLGPASGKMACGDIGYGRFMEPETIVEALLGESNYLFQNIEAALVTAPRMPTQVEEKTKNILLVIHAAPDALQSYELISTLKAKGYTVQCAISEKALKLLPKKGLQTISNQKAISEHYEDDIEGMEHIRLAEKADLVLIAPAEATLTAEMARGGATNFVNCIYLATKKPVVLYPSSNAAYTPKQADIEAIKYHGVRVIDQRLSPEILADEVTRIFQNQSIARIA